MLKGKKDLRDALKTKQTPAKELKLSVRGLQTVWTPYNVIAMQRIKFGL